jgi:hypothetical protein
MGSIQSTHTASEIKDLPVQEAPPSSVSGRKSYSPDISHVISVDDEDDSSDESSIDNFESDEDTDSNDEEGTLTCNADHGKVVFD